MGSIYILLLFLSILFINLSHAAISSSNSRCIESEWKALMEFKGSLVNGSSSLSSWTGPDCCSWEGITCHNFTGHIQNLELDSHNFNSTMSPWLFNLSHLEVLSMVNCGFRGTIPNMFGKLATLTTLALPSNSFDSVFPDSLCLLTSLSQMDLSYSRLRGSLPLCLRNMASLTALNLGTNKLSGEILVGLGYLTQLTALDLSNNHFNSSIPPILGNLTRLEYLDVSCNSLIGELSESFFEGFKSLKGLIISGNQFLVFNVSSQWIPPFQIEYFQMGSVLIKTQFPPWLRTKNSLKGLILNNASISGAIPEWCLTAYPNLTYFDLSTNSLTGFLPTFDAINSASLQILKLSGNEFTGNIPDELCNLQSLTILSLFSNQLIGNIPFCLGNLKNLQVLDLRNNTISGHVPSELGSLGSLYFLHLNWNKLSGELPSLWKNLNSLITLDLGNNELQGVLPAWIGKEWSKLQFLRLESNNFSGEISENMCQLSSLQILNLAHNNLSGTIPSCLGNLSEMISDESGHNTRIDMYTDTLLNYIKGREMEYTSNLQFSKFISLSDNNLHGEIPAELMNLKGLQSLNLSNNELAGRIPENIGNLHHMESLDLSMNRLSGTIPQSLANIDALGYLNLSFNNLAGRIPTRNHFNTLDDPSIFKGNLGLCGKLAMKNCPGEDPGSSNKQNGQDSGNGIDDDSNVFEFSWIYAGTGPGFAVGFVGIICSLYFKDPWRNAYFTFIDNVYNRIWVDFAIKFHQIRS